MKKGLKVLIIIIIVLLILIGAVVCIYLFTDFLKTDKQVFLKHMSNAKSSIYSELKDEQLEKYFEKLKSTPFENNGKLIIKDNILSHNNMWDQEISLNGKVDITNTNLLQNIKIKNFELENLDMDVVFQDNYLGVKINNILKKYIAVKNENLKELAKELGASEEQLVLITDKIDESTIASIISKEDLEYIKEKYVKILINSLEDEMFSKAKSDEETIYSLKINETQRKEILEKIIIDFINDDTVLSIIKNVYFVEKKIIKY